MDMHHQLGVLIVVCRQGKDVEASLLSKQPGVPS
jgi:hypothetical protein